ncbi:hypothetical protein EXN68_08850 [Rhizobium rhizogenes]|uniref:Uncharacterized protein n=1 Tax=Rhizobium rhizogenes TaxID=359 RepID=A0A546XLD9_RHIRH|nr:hypothetical protein EXN68_08850 [Rhizobium rhizogenes]
MVVPPLDLILGLGPRIGNRLTRETWLDPRVKPEDDAEGQALCPIVPSRAGNVQAIASQPSSSVRCATSASETTARFCQ